MKVGVMLRGDRLRELREGKGYSRAKLADIVGVGTSQIERHESGENDATGEVIARYAKCFGVNTDYLLGMTDNPAMNINQALNVHEAAALSAWRHGDRFKAIKVIVEDE